MASTNDSSDVTFGTSNEWLVEDMYHRFRQDPSSVSEAWQTFFADYEPEIVAPRTSGEAPPVVYGSPGREATARSTASPPGGTDVAAGQPVPNGGIAPRVADEAKATAAPSAPATAPPASAPTQPGRVKASSKRLIGPSARIVEAMEASRDVPTATSVRSMPAKLLEVNRRIINNQLARLSDGRKVSFTHIIGWAVVRALVEMPAMNNSYAEVDGVPHVVSPGSINLGIAIDLARKDGSRTLLVPNIKAADTMDFRQFWLSYEDIVHRVRSGAITPDDFAGTTASLTNPGTIGTIQSVPRLMPGQGLIVGVGAISFPPEYEAADPSTIARLGVGRVMNITSTYDHRVIQGAESGAFLARIHQFLLGEDDFYESIFRALGIPYVPAVWAIDDNPPWGSEAWASKQARVFQLINMYRVRGHLIADLDPLRMKPPGIHPELDPITHGLTIWDLERNFAVGGLGGNEQMVLGDVLGLLRDAYCRTVGVEYRHIQEPGEKEWIQRWVERKPEPISPEQRKRVITKLNHAEAFEQFLQTKYLGQKRFGLDGAESMIPLLDEVLNSATADGMKSAIIGMAHRGRLNVLANIIGKSHTQIFKEFEGRVSDDVDDDHLSGDVKYHLGAEGIHVDPEGNELSVEVVANPSHLEAVDPVLEGIVRARQDQHGPGAEQAILPILIHGDAAFAGQGVVAETLNLSQLSGYRTGGTVHVVVNNQVGFTTDAEDARSSHYATDVAKAIQAPILHVNADDPEAVVRVAAMAFAYRQAFHKDVVIDLVCYRRLGHNEADEPAFTQPLMYRKVDKHRSVRKLYLEQLVKRGELTIEEGDKILSDFNSLLSEALAESRGGEGLQFPEGQDVTADDGLVTGIDRAVIERIQAHTTQIPDGFTMHPKLVRVLENRSTLFAEGLVDWAMAETYAVGSLSLEGHRIRIAGEDSKRGTFSHRHAAFVDYNTEEEWIPVKGMDESQAPVEYVDSMLSEFAALGFEYGYSVASTGMLVAWEAQFGDFANGGQVIIDQFITSGEDKWNQTSNLTVMLPHGFEGQGPEHSSARIERYLESAAERNIRVVVPSTPATLFHMMRRQAIGQVRKPLILFTPKSLLRTRPSYSRIEDLVEPHFRPVLGDANVENATKVVFCTGKLYYELLDERTRDDLALVRLEQLYPFPSEEVAHELSRHQADAEIVWAQEEPVNMGAWGYVRTGFLDLLEKDVNLVSRSASTSPATGSFQ
ncbi:MAG: multifunctional oxoglutarate decarboxylase/oxoglutarate dehydrogenase thiamine pyrophosphate-binding subunit/dihydrolipoyllysine-residue succinyltransferase subunit, partial [Acidimicrobiia bacterium]|nr:multifunctional oxoglutarate decarboxylase/oxoglutarate dehydrogenase thiamine pyrophosphate-binding subunit/dihydrolipoyllysine-residue succinyltransferase subunit [Acidimicrobiia bacterium]